MRGRPQQNGSLPKKLGAEEINLLVRDLAALPALPAVARRLREMVTAAGRVSADGREAAMDRIAEVIALDPALAARFLASGGRCDRGEVPSIPGAVRRMGFEAVRSMALSMGASELAGRESASVGGLDRTGFWTHCLAVAWAGRMLVERAMLPIDPEQAFLCGLLHDIGKPAMDWSMPKSYARVVETVKAFRGNIADSEREIIGVDHSVFGRRLAEHWGLPEPIQRVIWMHHQPPEAVPQSLPDRPLVCLVGLADAIARRGGLGFSGNYTFPRTCEQLAAPLHIRPEVVAEVSGDLPGRIEQSQALVDSQAPARETPDIQSLIEANAELGRLNEELRRRAESLAAGAEALRHLRDFAAALRPDATTCETLVRIASVCAAGDVEISPAHPVVAYSVGEPDCGTILAARCDGSARPQWRTFPCRAALDSVSPAGPKAAAEAMAEVLADAGAIGDWLDLRNYEHHPLLCQGRWVGGVLCPSTRGDPGSAELRQALTGALALALAIVQGRSNAVLLSEQLAGASQVLAQTQEALAETKALAALGEMAAGAAHEMNTPLAVISGRAQLMRDRARSEEARKTWQLIADQAQRLSDIITDLMAFASPPRPQPERFDAGDLLREAAEAFSSGDAPQAGAAKVDIHIEAGTPPAWADAGQVRQVLAELMSNAVAAAKTAASIRLAAQGDEAHGAVLLSVQDDGPGMDERTLARAFAPFFSRQAAGRRRGMGLPKARRYVESNGGRMWIRSRIGEGTTVYVQLPVARGPGNQEEHADVQP